MNKFTEQKLDITADDRIFTPRGVGALNIGIVQCLSELIANSLDWRKFNAAEQKRIRQELDADPQAKEKFVKLYGRLLKAEPVITVVRIQYDGNCIEIWDNGIGMTLQELEVGLKLRAASDKKREPLRPRKGMFGMGMKVGILGAGWKFSIRSRSLFDEREVCVTIDTHEIENGTLSLKEVKGIVYDEHQTDGPLGNYESGTYIRIEDLHKRKHLPETWREELGRNFSPEIKYEGIQILIVDTSFGKNGELEPCMPEELEIVGDSVVDLGTRNLLVRRDLGNGEHGEPTKITGWIGLRVRGATGSGLWGLHTFRKGQLVEAFHNKGPPSGLMPKNPHPSLSRIHGEVHLDMCDPNFTKVGWNTELESWSEAREALKPVLDEMIELSQASYGTKKDGGAKYQKMLQRARAVGNEAVSKISEDQDEGQDEDTPRDKRKYVAIGDSKFLKVSVAQQAFTHANTFWDYSYRGESKEIAVIVNTDSDLWRWAGEGTDTERTVALIMRWAIVDCLYFCLVDDLHFDRNRALELRDKWHAELYRGDEIE